MKRGKKKDKTKSLFTEKFDSFSPYFIALIRLA